jgi:calcineurin-like phosphoesterase family protein
MINTFFIGDLHFSHKNIIGYCRPEFDNIDEMNETLIDRWNSVVRPRDNVWFMGDVCFGKHNMHLVGRLNGELRLVLGNHDHYPIEDYLLYFKKIVGVTDYKGCALTHIPIHPQQFYRWKLNIHGHMHEKSIDDDPRYFNVSCEQLNYIPIEWEQIKEQRKECFLK